MKFTPAIILAITAATTQALVRPNMVPKPLNPSTVEAVEPKLTHAEQVEFLGFTARQSKSYTNQKEFAIRQTQWKKTDDLIKTNQMKGVTLSHNKFSDWSTEERAQLLSLKVNQNANQLQPTYAMGRGPRLL